MRLRPAVCALSLTALAGLCAPVHAALGRAWMDNEVDERVHINLIKDGTSPNTAFLVAFTKDNEVVKCAVVRPSDGTKVVVTGPRGCRLFVEPWGPIPAKEVDAWFFMEIENFLGERSYSQLHYKCTLPRFSFQVDEQQPGSSPRAVPGDEAVARLEGFIEHTLVKSPFRFTSWRGEALVLEFVPPACVIL